MAPLSPFWRDVANKVIATLIAAALLGLGAWFLGVWPAVWGGIVAAFSFVGAALAFAVAIPVWLLLLVAIGLVLFGLRTRRSMRHLATEVQEAKEAEAAARSAAIKAEG